MSLWQDQITLWQYGVRTLLGVTATAVATPDADDMRFRDPLWCSNVGFDLLKQSYLLWAKHVQFLVDDFDGLEPRRRKRLGYFTRQLINALAPTNFPLTNPEVLRKTLETNGDNLVSGLRLLLEDHRHSSGILNVCMSQPGAFELGRDIACTAGYVVAENRLMQLIQYSPQTEQVYRVPILIVPSWINKYYILDLTPKTSFIQWLVAQGYTVFVISWINPDATHCEAGFADYMSQGPLAAVAVIERLTGEPQVAAIGYCLGGVLLASTVAYGDVAGERRFASATYLAASIDFSDPGDMGMFIDEETVEELEEEMSEQGYLDGRLLAVGFNLLRENDLYWSYYVTNYLKGERPPALHLLHWNTDSTHIPAATHSFVLRELHLHNR
jgi:polyhydroxyalkanoate synthase